MDARWRRVAVVVLAAVLIPAAACSGDDGGGASSGGRSGCAADGSGLRRAGRITIATPKPAVSPWFEDDEPANGKGFESEVAFAVAGKMGLPPGKVRWTRSSLARAVAPGTKPFDVYIGEAVATPARRRHVDLSTPYYRLDQALVARTGSPAAATTTVTAAAALRLGVLSGSSSENYVRDVVRAKERPATFSDATKAAAALQSRDVDALVVDLATATRLADAPGASVVVAGQFTERPDPFSFVLPKGSDLTRCVNSAVAALAKAGTLQVLEQSYLTEYLDVPPLAS
jgi:polar amino acid transport system substrate-binding protein